MRGVDISRETRRLYRVIMILVSETSSLMRKMTITNSRREREKQTSAVFLLSPGVVLIRGIVGHIMNQ